MSEVFPISYLAEARYTVSTQYMLSIISIISAAAAIVVIAVIKNKNYKLGSCKIINHQNMCNI